MKHHVVRPTLVLPSVDGTAELSVWPPIPGGNATPVVQIDVVGEEVSVAVEYTKEQAVRLATAILAAAYLPTEK